ncbi:MAG: transglycosylase SLT domain-containing protein [Acidiphilium sp.]|nr:transglycosylase SLT domain-containing protein [Acidiphilium sp.]MDD4934684.1 transglycosylase SLT domain-containing protein [Acidiphilium sp.]
MRLNWSQISLFGRFSLAGFTPPLPHLPRGGAVAVVIQAVTMSWGFAAGRVVSPAAYSLAPYAVCAQAARTASAQSGVPAGLLRAIGSVESGLTNAPTGARTAWPYAVDADGAGHWFATAREATDFVRWALKSGMHAVDVGCFQIDLQDHPDAFESLEQAFDPAANAAFAAGFLIRLHTRLGSWAAAAAAYHSATPARGAPYAQRVMAVWHHDHRDNITMTGGTADPYVIHLQPPSGPMPAIVTP